MKTTKDAIPPFAEARLLDRWEVQRHDMLRGWNTWVIYDEQNHAENECARRISESPERDKRSWRVKRSNGQAHPTAAGGTAKPSDASINRI